MTEAELRQLVCNIASGEEQSTDSAKYWREVLPITYRGAYPPHWCGAFTLWCLRQALGCQWTWQVEKGYLYRLRPTQAPEIGDICYKAEPYQHHAVLTAVGDDYTITQDGNSGSSPGICLEHFRKKPFWTCYYSIAPLLAESPLKNDNT